MPTHCSLGWVRPLNCVELLSPRIMPVCLGALNHSLSAEQVARGITPHRFLALQCNTTRLNTTMRERRDLPDGVLDGTAICGLTDRTVCGLEPVSKPKKSERATILRL